MISRKSRQRKLIEAIALIKNLNESLVAQLSHLKLNNKDTALITNELIMMSVAAKMIVEKLDRVTKGVKS